MCDYSLHGVANRPAKIGDKLVSTNFINTITRGFTEVDQPKVAVCLLPGTELKIDTPLKAHRRDISALVQFLIGPRIIEGGIARFVQVNKNKPDRHHDALEFPDGSVVMVTDLLPGQHAEVLQLPVGEQQLRDQDQRLSAASVRRAGERERA